jgi:hypothetical protein
MPDPIAAWALAALIARAPPDRLATAQAAFGAGETAEERADRYRSYAEDLAAAVRAGAPLFKGSRARALTAGVLLGVAFHETGLARDADVGPCRSDGAHRGRCDGGRAACSLQVLVGAGVTAEGWSREDLFADRRKCFASALAVIRRSWRACASSPPALRFAAWNAGSCDHPIGRRRSAQISSSVRWFTGRTPIPVDEEIPPA